VPEGLASPVVITPANTTEFFRDCVADAVHNQHVDASEDALHYLVTLLSDFTRSSHLFTPSEDGLELQPVAELYREAVQGRTPELRAAALRRMGDIALFVAGTFSAHLSRRGLSTDYYIAMGGSAYDSLAQQRADSRLAPLRNTFDELARQFGRFVDIVAEVSQSGRIGNDRSVLNLYETWLRTGDRQTELALRRAGIFPVAEADQEH